MPKTDFTSGALTASGTFSIPNPGWGVIPANCGMVVSPPGAYWYHRAGHLSRSFVLGPVSVHVECRDASYRWTNGAWEYTGGSQTPGYPENLPEPSKACATAVVRGLVTSVIAAGVTDINVWRSGYVVTTWPSPCNLVDPLQTVVSGQDIEGGVIGWSIELAALPLCQSITQITTPARAYATCVQQLRDQYWWQSDAWDVRGSCGGASARNEEATWNSVGLPGWSASLSFGSGREFVRCLDAELCPGGLACDGGAAFKRIADNHEVTWSLSDQYPGLRASGSHVRYVDPYYEDDVLTYYFGNGYMRGSVSSRNAVSSCCDPSPETDVASTETEYGRASTRVGIDLVAFDQMTAIGSSAGLEATIPHFIDNEMTWDEDEQRYIRSEYFGRPRLLSVPGDYTAYWCHTSRYDDQICPIDENDTMVVRLTGDCLRALDLPTADDVMPIFDGALDRIGIDRSDWGEYDKHGGSYKGALDVWVQSSLSIQWPQDDRDQPEPPSWWELTGGSAFLNREGSTLIVHGSDDNPLTLRRSLAWHPTRRNPQYYGPIAPGIPESQLWMWIGDWSRVAATKHLLKGMVTGGPFPMTSNNVTCGEGDPVHHWAFGIMPWSEDVTDWRAYCFLGLIVTCDRPEAWTLGVRVGYEYDEIFDNYRTRTDERREGFIVNTISSVAEYSVEVPANATEEVLIIDLISAGMPYLERVRWIELTGIVVSDRADLWEFRLHDMSVLLPDSDSFPEDGNVRIENTDQRPVRYGGEPRYSCGDYEFLGVAKTPEEYGGWWAVGGHCIVRSPRHPGRTVDVAPPYGMPYVSRVDTDCGALQDRLMDWVSWYDQVFGSWGLEGFYGVAHTSINSYMGGIALKHWVDDEEVPLGLVPGSGWITHIPILLDYPIVTKSFLRSGDAWSRISGGGTLVPSVVRSGYLRICEGINHALGQNETPYWGAKHHLYGSALCQGLSWLSPTRRAPYNQSWKLYERNETTNEERLVATDATDPLGRLRFIRGVNEFRHVEYGAEPEWDPDYSGRDDYRSSFEGPPGTFSPKEYILKHYQPIPSWSYKKASEYKGKGKTSLYVFHPEEHIYLAVDPSSGTFRIDVCPDPSDSGVPVTIVNQEGYNPIMFSTTDGMVRVLFDNGVDISMGFVPLERVDRIPPTSSSNLPLKWVRVLLQGFTCPAVFYDDKTDVWNIMAYSSHSMWYIRAVGSGDMPEEFEDPVQIGLARDTPGDIQMTIDGHLIVAYTNVDGTMIVRKKSRDGGKTWEPWE